MEESVLKVEVDDLSINENFVKGPDDNLRWQKCSYLKLVTDRESSFNNGLPQVVLCST